MSILLIGLNHKTANVDIRERLAFSGCKYAEGIDRLRSLPLVREVALLSTCNRVEIYAYVHDAVRAGNEIKEFLADFHRLERSLFEPSLYVHADEEAVRHIFRVSSSLDSMVVGEPQILGQIKDAFDFALLRKTTGVILNRLLKKAISTAKRVRTETRIAESAVSISFAAVELAKKIFTGLQDKSFMLLGAGDMAELAARHLVNNGVKDVAVANRTFERGCELARDLCGRAVRFEDIHQELLHCDILICSTGAPTYVLTKDQMQKVMRGRRQQPVFIIDISVPRNIDPEINDLDNVYLYNIDDLQGVVEHNLQERQKEAEKAGEIVREEVGKFTEWLSSLDAVPTIVSLRKKAERVRDDELRKFRDRFPDIEETRWHEIELLAASITNKLMHPPTAALRNGTGDRETMIATVRKMYGLDEEA